MTRKNTANRPSQANQEYVTRSDGTKVKNLAYRGPAQKTRVDAPALDDFRPDNPAPRITDDQINKHIDELFPDADTDDQTGEIVSYARDASHEAAVDRGFFGTTYRDSGYEADPEEEVIYEDMLCTVFTRENIHNAMRDMVNDPDCGVPPDAWEDTKELRNYTTEILDYTDWTAGYRPKL